MPDRIDRVPSRSGYVAGMKNSCGKSTRRFVEQVTLDLCFPDPVITERLAGRCLIVRPVRGVAVNPESAAVKELFHAPAQTLDDLPGGVDVETDEVGDYVAFERCDESSELTIALERGTIDAARSA